jgi:hypothetical protein
MRATRCATTRGQAASAVARGRVDNASNFTASAKNVVVQVRYALWARPERGFERRAARLFAVPQHLSLSSRSGFLTQRSQRQRVETNCGGRRPGVVSAGEQTLFNLRFRILDFRFPFGSDQTNMPKALRCCGLLRIMGGCRLRILGSTFGFPIQFRKMGVPLSLSSGLILRDQAIPRHGRTVLVQKCLLFFWGIPLIGKVPVTEYAVLCIYAPNVRRAAR